MKGDCIRRLRKTHLSVEILISESACYLKASNTISDFNFAPYDSLFRAVIQAS